MVISTKSVTSRIIALSLICDNSPLHATEAIKA